MALLDRFKKKAKAKSPKQVDQVQAAKTYAGTPAAIRGAVQQKAGKPAKQTSEQKSDKKPTEKELTDKRPEEKEVTIADPNLGRYAGILLKPHVSEKASVLADRGVYVFDVPLHANKIEIGKAVEAIYNVDVTDVRTQRGIGKPVRRGRVTGRRNTWKKALVQLKKGQTISIVEGV